MTTRTESYAAAPTTRVEFYSSVAGERLWGELCEELTRLGFPSTIVAAVKPQDYRGAKSKAGRLWLRWRLTGGFALACAFRLLRARWSRSPLPVIRVVTSNPFFLPAWVEFFSSRRDRTVHLLFDLYPEALLAAGWTKRGSVLARIIARITRRTLRRCDATVFLGQRIEEHVSRVHARAPLSAVIPVGSGGALFREKRPQVVPKDRPVTVLYAGVMGRMHDVDTIAGVLASGLPSGLRLKAHATGRGAEWLRTQPGSDQVAWGGALADAEWERTMNEAAVGLITLSAGAERVAMPSKTYSALVAGQAVLAVCQKDSDLAALVREHDCGWVVEPGDVAGLRSTLELIASDRELLHAKRERAFAAGHGHYAMAPVARRWAELFGRMEHSRKSSLAPR